MKTASLSFIRAGWGSAEIAELCQALPDFTALKHLDLKGNPKIGVEIMAKVGNSYKKRFKVSND